MVVLVLRAARSNDLTGKPLFHFWIFAILIYKTNHSIFLSNACPSLLSSYPAFFLDYALNSEFTLEDFPSRGRNEDFFLKYSSVLRNFPDGAKGVLPSTNRILRRSLSTPTPIPVPVEEGVVLWLRLLVVLLLLSLLPGDPIFLLELAPVFLPDLAPVPLLVLDKENRSSRAFFLASLSRTGRAVVVTAENIPTYNDSKQQVNGEQNRGQQSNGHL